jgi:hypothetical protein
VTYHRCHLGFYQAASSDHDSATQVEVAIKLIQVAIMEHLLMEIAAVVLLITAQLITAQLITAQRCATALVTVILYATALPYATIL